jgi:hypothetical protein
LEEENQNKPSDLRRDLSAPRSHSLPNDGFVSAQEKRGRTGLDLPLHVYFPLSPPASTLHNIIISQVSNCQSVMHYTHMREMA